MIATLTQNLLVFGGLLFCIGLVGFLTRRSLILMFLSLEMMLSGVSVNLIAFSRHHQNYEGQIMAIMVLTVAACEAAIALALVVSLYRRKATLDIKAWDDLSETIIPKIVEPPMAPESHLAFPKLTPAGLDPMENPVPSTFTAESGEVADRINTRSSEATTHA